MADCIALKPTGSLNYSWEFFGINSRSGDAAPVTDWYAAYLTSLAIATPVRGLCGMHAFPSDKTMQDPLLAKANTDTYLGFDFGTKKIGLAVGQTITATASPLQTIRSINQKPNWEIIGKLIQEWNPAGLVVGISKQADGSDNPVTPLMLKFCRQLEGRYQLPVFQQDETLSTFEAKQMLFDEVNVSAGKLWEVQDQLAAQLILQTWLNDHTKKDS